MVVKKNECYQCKDRKIGCHDTCQKYKEYVEKNKKYKADARNDKAYNGETNWGYIRQWKRKK